MFRSVGSFVKYLIAFCMGLLCAMPCLWAPACLLDNYCWKKKLTRWNNLRRCSCYKSPFSLQETSVQETCPGIGARRDQFRCIWNQTRSFSKFHWPSLAFRRHMMLPWEEKTEKIIVSSFLTGLALECPLDLFLYTSFLLCQISEISPSSNSCQSINIYTSAIITLGVYFLSPGNTRHNWFFSG